MKISYSDFFRHLLIVISAFCVLALAALTFQSLFRLFGPQPEHEKTTTAVSENGLTGPEVKSVHEEGGPRPPGAGPRRRSELGAHLSSISTSPPTASGADFSPDFQSIREQEKGRRAMIEDLRREARENPDADHIPSEEELKKIEESGADFL